MITRPTAEKIDHGLRALRIAQAKGEAPPPGAISNAELARRCGVSEDTIDRLFHIALAKVAARLSPDDLPPHLARRASRFSR